MLIATIIDEQLGSGDRLVKNKIFSTVKKYAEDLCPDEIRKRIYEAYPEVRDSEPRKYKEGTSSHELSNNVTKQSCDSNR